MDEHFFKKDYFNKLTVPDAYLTKPLNYFIWLTEDCPEILLDAAINFDTSNGISIAERHEDFIEYYCFATHRSNRAIINNFYLSNLDSLHRYGLQFKEQAADLFEQVKREKLMIKTEDNTKMICSRNDVEQIGLSKRELDCSSALLNGLKPKKLLKSLGYQSVRSNIISRT